MTRRAVPLWRAIVAQLRIELALTLRRGETLLVTFGIPLALLIFFGSVPIAASGSGRPVDFLLPGILALAIMSTSMVGLGIATAYERHYGVLKRLGGSPLSRVGLLAAKMLSVAVVEFVQAVLLGIVAVVLFGWRPTGAVIYVLPALLLGTATFAGLGLLMAGTLRAEATLGIANGLYLLLLLLGDMVVPLEMLPGWLAGVARLLPAAALADALRTPMLGSGPFPLGSLGVLGAWAILVVGLAVRSFRWE